MANDRITMKVDQRHRGRGDEGRFVSEFDRVIESLWRSDKSANFPMIWSPSHGDTAFTVPLFDEFRRRIMPGDDWRD